MNKNAVCAMAQWLTQPGLLRYVAPQSTRDTLNGVRVVAKLIIGCPAEVCLEKLVYTEGKTVYRVQEYREAGSQRGFVTLGHYVDFEDALAAGISTATLRAYRREAGAAEECEVLKEAN